MFIVTLLDFIYWTCCIIIAKHRHHPSSHMIMMIWYSVLYQVMIYLIDKVLPESYFANNLRALSVDMAVFRDLLRLKLPELSQQLHHLQKVANRTGGGEGHQQFPLTYCSIPNHEYIILALQFKKKTKMWCHERINNFNKKEKKKHAGVFIIRKWNWRTASLKPSVSTCILLTLRF